MIVGDFEFYIEAVPNEQTAITLRKKHECFMLDKHDVYHLEFVIREIKRQAGWSEYIRKPTTHADMSHLIKRNNELTRIAEELEYKLEKADRHLKEILQPIRDVLKRYNAGECTTGTDFIVSCEETIRLGEK